MYKGEFKAEANRQICPSLGQLMNTVNSMLIKQTTIYNLPSGFTFDYGLIKNPEVRDSFLDFELKGAFGSSFVNRLYQMQYLRAPMADAPKRMALARVSDFVFNSFFSHAIKKGLFNEVHLEKMNADIKRMLKLSCSGSEHCIGKLSPNMTKTFTDNTGKNSFFNNILTSSVTNKAISPSYVKTRLASTLDFKIFRIANGFLLIKLIIYVR